MAVKKELTIEYIDKKFAELGSKFATKDDLKAQTLELKQFAEEQTEHLARIISTTVAEPLEMHMRDVSMFEEVSMAVWKQISNKHKRA